MNIKIPPKNNYPFKVGDSVKVNKYYKETFNPLDKFYLSLSNCTGKITSINQKRDVADVLWNTNVEMRINFDWLEIAEDNRPNASFCVCDMMTLMREGCKCGGN